MVEHECHQVAEDGSATVGEDVGLLCGFMILLNRHIKLYKLL